MTNFHLCAKPTCLKQTDNYFCDKHIKAYNKTWHYKISRFNTWPKNMISGRPIKLFGIYLFCIMHIANKDYQWQNN